jgi:peptidoglycan hydrolase CwlO-like protein
MNPKTTAAFVKFLKEQGVEEAQKADGDAGLTSHDQRFDNIDRELHSIRTELDDLQEKVDNITGYRKEIDHALERVTAIEKHLGLDRKISA